MFRRIVRIVFVAVIAAVAYLLLWPTDIDPVAWDAPAAPPLEGRYPVNDDLAAVRVIGANTVSGPEDVAVDPEGRVYAAALDGRIVRMNSDGSNPVTVTETGGRPLGLDWNAEGRLIVADADEGLLRVDVGTGETEVLATEAGGVPFKFTDDVDVAPDGTIYFTDASSRWGYGEAVKDIFEHRENGRLLAYDPESGETRVLLDELQFANGVAVAEDGSFVLVNETGNYLVRRYWLTGDKKGGSEIVIDNLPGFPDGISTGSGGTFWIALYAPRNPEADDLAGQPFLRKVIWRLPDALKPQPIHYGFVLGIGADGEVRHNLQDPAGGYAPITSVEEVDGTLWLGSLAANGVGRMPRP